MNAFALSNGIRLSLLLLAAAAAAQGPGGQAPPPEVFVEPALESTVPISYDFVGLTNASRVVEVRSRIQGFLETRDFEEGAFIESGTMLFSIDARPFKADREIAVAQVEQAETRLQLARQEVKRLQSVSVPGAIAESDLDRQLAEEANAAAALKLAKAQLAKADLELSYTTIEAPLTGFIGKAEKEIGSLVDAGTNSLLVTMRQVDPIYVSFQVSERDWLAWREASVRGELILSDGLIEPYLEITLLDGTQYSERGVINFEAANIDTNTGNVEVRATFSNKDNALKAGQFVKAHIRGWVRPKTVTVRQRSINQSPQGAFVYVIKANNTAEMRAVTLGAWIDDRWIVLSGLQAGESVVVEGLTRVQPGISVNPQPYAPTSPPPAAE
jgi:membrane fusion protein (multidrug efflux system)